ncbi:MAG: cysteine peptidase family C39 domain-containing protein [Pirellula sp.]
MNASIHLCFPGRSLWGLWIASAVWIVSLDFQIGFASNTEDKNLCGSQCLYVALRGLSPETAPQQFEKLTDFLGRPNPQGYSIAELQTAAIQFGLNAECLKLNHESLIEMAKHCRIIVHLKPSHFVLFKTVDESGVVVFDPSSRTRSLTKKQLDNEWDGNCLVLGKDSIVFRRGSNYFSKGVQNFTIVGVVLSALLFGGVLIQRYVRRRTN